MESTSRKFSMQWAANPVIFHTKVAQEPYSMVMRKGMYTSWVSLNIANCDNFLNKFCNKF